MQPADQNIEFQIPGRSKFGGVLGTDSHPSAITAQCNHTSSRKWPLVSRLFAVR